MTDVATLPLTEERVAEVLMQARGDLFVASQMLNMTSVRLDRMIRSSEALQAVWLALRQVRASAEYDKLSTEQVEAEVSRRMSHYRADGLEALHELATMDHGDNAGLAQVRLMAASRLSGPAGEFGQASDLQQTLAHLNAEYQRTAPRIREIRQTVVTLETEPRLVSDQ